MSTTTTCPFTAAVASDPSRKLAMTYLAKIVVVLHSHHSLDVDIQYWAACRAVRAVTGQSVGGYIEGSLFPGYCDNGSLVRERLPDLQAFAEAFLASQ